MMADGGVWQGTPIISADWHELSTTWKVDPDGHPRLGYGYYWWTVPEAASYSAWGHGGQYALVIPGQGLVLVMISMPDPQGETLHGGEIEEFLDLTRPLWGVQ
jgi:CubicO group peptidase (beta-lactamase class C family)